VGAPVIWAEIRAAVNINAAIATINTTEDAEDAEVFN
jgi:hypothetical protein